MQLPERIGAAGNPIAPIELSVHVAGEGPAIVPRSFSRTGSPNSPTHGDIRSSPWSTPVFGSSCRINVATARAIRPPRSLNSTSSTSPPTWWESLIYSASRKRSVPATIGEARSAGPCRSCIRNTPYALFPGTDLLRLAFPDPDKLYLLWFQEPGVAEGVMDTQVRACFELLMRRAEKPDRDSIMDPAAGTDDVDANPFRRLSETEPMGKPLLSNEELETYVRAFKATGFRGGINWYRNLDRNRELFPTTGVQKLDLPCLMVTAEWDLALPPALAEPMSELCSDLEVHMIEECGHWTQQEKPDELNAIMVDWLKRRYL